MRFLAWSAALLLGLGGCGEGSRPAVQKSVPGDTAAGKAFVERDCKGCHGLDGRGIAPAIPHLAAQSDHYLVAALQAYKTGRRTHAALKDMAARMSDADVRNIAAYYASLPPLPAPAKTAPALSPFEHGKALAAPCARCHGADGNSPTPGIPSLAGQQPGYMVIAMQEYGNRERKAAAMHAVVPGLKKRDMESLALYFASQAAAPRAARPKGDATAGEPLTAVCGGCHGTHGVSLDSATPSLAGQDERYLVAAIKAYRTTRQRESMRMYVRGLSERDIDNVAAFYASQKSSPAEHGQTLIQDLTDKCERCHGPGAADNAAMVVPKIDGQDRDYLVMALRAYRDDRRDNSAMHRMSLPYSDAVIDSLATVYAAREPK
jgi:cytochrome c553